MKSISRLFLFSLLLAGCSGESEVITYHPNGMIQSKGDFNSDKLRVGIWTTWYDNGQKEAEETFKNGVSDGLFKSWYRDTGRQCNEGFYKDGVMIGSWDFWDKHGNEI